VKQAFSPYRKLSGPPINIVQFQGDHFSRPKAEACKEKKNRIVTTTNGGSAIAGFEKGFELIGFKVLWHFG
jgi:hypothetical protein